MLKISTDQLWDMIYNDKDIKRKLEEKIKSDQEKRTRCYTLYQNQLFKVQELKTKIEDIEKKFQEQDDKINQCHLEISILELQIIVIKNRIKTLGKLLSSPATPNGSLNGIQKRITQEQQKIAEIQKKQNKLRDNIQNIEQETEQLKSERSELKERLAEEEKNTNIANQNVAEWDISIETKKNIFYQTTFDFLQSDYKQLQKVVGRNLEVNKKMTEKEAKENTKSFLFGDDQIAIDPPGQVRRLTKEDKEKLPKIQEL